MNYLMFQVIMKMYLEALKNPFGMKVKDEHSRSSNS
jgi:hypothetical protein